MTKQPNITTPAPASSAPDVARSISPLPWREPMSAAGFEVIAADGKTVFCGHAPANCGDPIIIGEPEDIAYMFAAVNERPALLRERDELRTLVRALADDRMGARASYAMQAQAAARALLARTEAA